jgi:hypothetical protein
MGLLQFRFVTITSFAVKVVSNCFSIENDVSFSGIHIITLTAPRRPGCKCVQDVRAKDGAGSKSDCAASTLQRETEGV